MAGTGGTGGEAKSEDERRDELAEEALERQRSAALAVHRQANALKRKRADLEEERTTKRRRQQPGAVLLDTGRIKTMLTSTTLVNLRPMMFMSSSMAWAPGPTMSVRRGACAAVVLDADRLLVLGGNEGDSSFGTTEVLDFRDIRKLSFSPGPRLTTQRRECTAILLDAERLLVLGGYDGAHFLNTTEILDLKANRFVTGPRMHVRRAAPACAMLKTGHVIVLGGKNSSGCLSSSELLDPSSKSPSFVHGPSMRMQRAGPTVAPLEGDRLIVIGGHDSSRTHNTTEILYITDRACKPPSIIFTPGPQLVTPRSYFAGVMLNAGNLHVIGGHDGYNYLSTTDVLNLATMEFTTGPCMKQKRFMCAAVSLMEGRVMVFGGCDVTADHNSTELFGLAMYSFMPARWMTMC